MSSSMLSTVLMIVIAIAVLALIYAASLFSSVKKENSGNKRMRALSSYIHEGGHGFF